MFRKRNAKGVTSDSISFLWLFYIICHFVCISHSSHLSHSSFEFEFRWRRTYSSKCAYIHISKTFASKKFTILYANCKPLRATKSKKRNCTFRATIWITLIIKYVILYKDHNPARKIPWCAVRFFVSLLYHGQ